MRNPNHANKTIAFAPIEKHSAALIAAAPGPPSQTGGLPTGFTPDPNNDMTFDGGRTIADLSYTNFFLGAWDPADRTSIDDALRAIMTDPGLNDILAQYFPGQAISATFRPSSALPPPTKATMNKPDVEGLVTKLHAAGKFAGFDLPNTVFNFMLPRGTFLTDLGGPGNAADGDEPEVYAPVPFVWSDQYDRKIQSVGHFRGDDEMEVVHGSLEERRFVAVFGREGRLVGALGFSMPAKVMRYRKMIAERATFADALERARAS